MLCMQKKNVNWTEHYKRKRRASNDSLSFWRFTYYHTLEPSAAPGQRSGMLFFFLLFFQHSELSIVLCFAPVIFVHVTVKMVMMRSVFRINDWNGMERTWKWEQDNANERASIINNNNSTTEHTRSTGTNTRQKVVVEWCAAQKRNENNN